MKSSFVKDDKIGQGQLWTCRSSNCCYFGALLIMWQM